MLARLEWGRIASDPVTPLCLLTFDRECFSALVLPIEISVGVVRKRVPRLYGGRPRGQKEHVL